MSTTLHQSDDLPARIIANYHLFATVRQQFIQPGVERGGCPRSGLTPVYVRKFGTYASTIFPNLATVESSFDSQQLQAITQTIVLLKGWIAGNLGESDLTTRILEQYNCNTHPYLGAAILRSTEEILVACITANPEYAPAFDALFRVAGSEGFRDLIQLHGTRLLEQTMRGEEPILPDILAFVNMHERPMQAERDSWTTVRYEVWCPGYDVSKVFYQQCQAAARQLIQQRKMRYIARRDEELAALPAHFVQHLTSFVQRCVMQVLATYGVSQL